MFDEVDDQDKACEKEHAGTALVRFENGNRHRVVGKSDRSEDMTVEAAVSDDCIVPSAFEAFSETEDEACGDTRLVLGVGMEMSVDIVDLDKTEGEEGYEFKVESTAYGCCESVAATAVERLVSVTGKCMDIKTERKGDFGAEEIGLFVHAGAQQRAIVSAEVRGDADDSARLEGTGKLPAVEIRVIVGGGGRARGLWTNNGNHGRDRGAKVGVAAEEFDFLR
jgi:hypothetical protein